MNKFIELFAVFLIDPQQGEVGINVIMPVLLG
jgi:hypothetical protein